ncbi:MAG TPA: aminomethyltransferase family protein, partial [Methylomirabilota bacterium]|nr:aminomethyltransferase family protein [Methylomirabilota bacterium]
APPGVEARDRPSFRRTNWFAHVGTEARAVRAGAGLLELSSFSKYEVRGPGAAAFLDRLCANRLPPPGRIVLSQLLNPRGTIESDVTVTRLQPERFLLVSAAVAELHDLDWLLRHAPADGTVVVENVTGRHGVLILAGPRSRDVLSRVTEADLSNAAFPWLTVQEITVEHTPVRALRVNFVGELGWELHHPTEGQLGLYQALKAAGGEFGIVDFGLRAMDSLRLEKGYRAWGADLNTEVTPLEAGLDRFVAFDKGEFIGRAALLAQRRDGVRKRLATLDVAAVDADCWGHEPVRRDGRVVGITTSGGYAHWLGKSLAVAYVEAGAALPGTRLEVEILGEWRSARVVAEPLFDPDNRRPRGC